MQVGFPLLLDKHWPEFRAWIRRFYKVDFVDRGMFSMGKWAFPCRRTKLEKGSRTLEVLLSMLNVVWRNHHTSWGTFWKNLMNMRMSQHIWLHPNLWFHANGTEARGNGCYAFGRWEAPPPVYKQIIGAA